MSFRIQIRRDTADKWTINNPILLSGEIGYETDTTYAKIGDGTTPWNELDYWNPWKNDYKITVQQGNTVVQSPTNLFNFNPNDFTLNSIPGRGVYLSLNNSGGGAGNYSPFFQVTVQLQGANFGNFISSRGPDGEPLTGPSWNFAFNNSGNNLTIVHNTGTRPISLSLHGQNGGSVFIKSPVGTSTSQFTLASSSDYSNFTVYQVNTANTGAASSGIVDIIWQFGATM
jgi:hypothetical protein